MTILHVGPASQTDIPFIFTMIKEFAEYVRLSHEVAATEESLRETFFGSKRYAEVIFARVGDQPASFAIFFHNFSTFLGKPGIYLEDLFVRPEFRGKGIDGRTGMIRVPKDSSARNG